MANPWDHVVDTAEYGKTLNHAEEIIGKAGCTINPDDQRVQKVVGLMTMNFTAAGKYYCPCKQSHPLDTEKDVICPCPEMEAEIDADGFCFCKLFFT